jgi:MFS family permease
VNSSLFPISPEQSHAFFAKAARGFQSLRNRNYRLFWTGQMISLTGTWMQTTAQAWLVLRLTNGSPFALGVVTTLQFLPVMLLALYGGVLADRLPKRLTIVITQALLMIQAFVFGGLVATGAIQIWHIYVLAVLQGIITAVDNPVRQAFLFEMVGRDDLVNAVGLNSMSFNGARIFGPALAGVVIKLIGIAPALILNAVSFIPVIWALLLIDASKLFAVPPDNQESMFSRLKEGLAFAWNTPIILTILIVAAFIGTFGFNFTVIVPLIADSVLKTDETGLGLLFAAMGVGALLAAMATAYSERLTLRRQLISAGLFGLCLCVLALSTQFWLSALLLLVTGAAAITSANAANTLLQLNSPDRLRGRVISINVLLTQGSTPIGGFLLGALGQLAGVPFALMLFGLLCVVGVGLALAYRWRLAHQAQPPIEAG